MQNSQKGFSNIIAVVVIMVVFATGYFLVNQKADNVNTTQTPLSETSQVDTSNWKTYQNPIHNYSFKYPESNYTIDDSDPSGEGYAKPGEFGNFLFKDRGLPTYEEAIAVTLLRTPKWAESTALEKAFNKGGVKEVANLSREVNFSKKEYYFPNKKVSDVKEFFFKNGSGYGFTVTGTFAFGFNSARKDGIDVGGKVVEGERVFVYVTDGKNIYSVEFPNRPLENQIFSTFEFTEPLVKIDTSTWETYMNKFTNYSLNFPKNTDWCIAADMDCKKDASINGDFYLTSLPSTEGIPQEFSIVAYKSNLKISGVDAAKRSLELNKRYSPSTKDNYTSEQIINFAGEPAYTFTAINQFGQSGFVLDAGISLLTDPELLQRGPGEWRLLDGEHVVTYFEHDGYFFRIIYPNTDIYKKIASTFKFTK